MKAFLMIATAVVALAAAPAFAGGMKTTRYINTPMPATNAEARPPAALPGGCPHNQPACGGWVQTQDGRMIRPNRAQQDAREAPVTADLNNQLGVREIWPTQFGAIPRR